MNRSRREILTVSTAAIILIFYPTMSLGQGNHDKDSSLESTEVRSTASNTSASTDKCDDHAKSPLGKNLAFLSAETVDGKVRITCFKSTPYFEATQKEEPNSVRLRIWRMELPDFRFGRDYTEYFDGLSWRDANVIFEGAIPALNNRKYAFMDDNVSPAQTYAYWVATEREETPTGAVAVRVRDPRVWWSWEEVERRLNDLIARFPDVVEARVVGRTVHGRVLRALIAGRRDRVLVLVGSVHAGESGPELIIPAFEQVLQEHGTLLKNVGLAILPCVNADQRERLARGYPPYLRTNSSGVDLNRNFAAGWETVDYNYGLITTDPDGMTYRGPAPASEPETAAVMRALEGLTPAAVLSYHHLASITGSTFLYPKAASADSDYAARCRELNRVYRAAMAPEDLEERPVAAAAGCTGGSLPAWIYDKFHVPACDVEGDRSAICVRSALDTATWDDLKQCQERHTRAIVALLTAMGEER